MQKFELSFLKKPIVNILRQKIITSWRWITSNNVRRILAIAFLLIITALLFALLRTDNRAVLPTSMTNAPSEKDNVRISSEPVGIVIPGPKKCSESFITPYECKVATGMHSMFTAPATAETNGKKMSFVTWEGCSASNQDTKICEVDINSRTTHSIKAVYAIIVANGAHSSTPSTSDESDTPPISDCPNSPNSAGIVTCTTTVFKAPFGYVFEVQYPRNTQNNKWYYAPVASNPYISCSSGSVCDSVNALPNSVPSIVSGLYKPGSMFIRLLSQAETGDGTKIVFDHWKVEYDPTRYPNIDPSQHTVYFVTAYYVISP